jgi:hypothetical protein
VGILLVGGAICYSVSPCPEFRYSALRWMPSSPEPFKEPPNTGRIKDLRLNERHFNRTKDECQEKRRYFKKKIKSLTSSSRKNIILFKTSLTTI